MLLSNVPIALAVKVNETKIVPVHVRLLLASANDFSCEKVLGLFLNIADLIPSIDPISLVHEFNFTCGLMIKRPNECVLEQVALIIECNYATIFRKFNCFLTCDFELDRVKPGFRRKS